MFTFNEDNVSTLSTDLLEHLELSDDFIVTQMYYKPNSNEMFCVIRKIVSGKFRTCDGYTVLVETGSEGGLFTIQDVVCDGHYSEFPQWVATDKPGYELQLVEHWDA